MNSKLKGIILTVVSVAGMFSIGTHLASGMWAVWLFVIFALFAADGITTIVADCKDIDEDEEKYTVPRFRRIYGGNEG